MDGARHIFKRFVSGGGEWFMPTKPIPAQTPGKWSGQEVERTAGVHGTRS